MALRDLAASWSAVDRDRWLVAVLLGGVALLLCELRFEHREVLGETWRSWIPLVYASVTLVGGLVALRRWDGKARRAAGLILRLSRRPRNGEHLLLREIFQRRTGDLRPPRPA
jgi:hypothetical protein